MTKNFVAPAFLPPIAAFVPSGSPRPTPCISAALAASLRPTLTARRAKFHAPFPLFPAPPARNTQGGGDRLASLHAGRRHLQLPTARLARPGKGMPHCARGAGPLRRGRVADADDSAGRFVAGKQP